MMALTFGGFLLTKNGTAPGARDTQSRDTISLCWRPTVKRECTTPSMPEQDSGDNLPLPIRIDLAQRNIDSLMAAIISQMESLADLMRELTALKQGVSCD